MTFRCTACQVELKEESTSTGGLVRCGRCGTLQELPQNSSRRVRGIGIHPALARRYQDTPHESSLDGTQTIVPDAEAREPAVAPEIPGYQLLECIGKGAMGRVYRALHKASGRETAVKVLSLELSGRNDLVARFEREAAALRAFRHPNVVAIFDSGSHAGVHYYCMEYVRGATLRTYLKNGPLPLPTSIRFMRAILTGLKAAHDRGIIHRDLKPENVLVEAGELGQERIVLVDFGLAGILNEAADPHPNLTRSRVTMGTVNYMAPEQHTDAKRVDVRSDLYACGVIFYECITGDLPLGRFLLPTERGLKVSPSVDACVTKALSRAPSERFQTAVEFDEALAQIETNVEVFVAPVQSRTEKEEAPSVLFSEFGGSNASSSPGGRVYYMPHARTTIRESTGFSTWAPKPLWAQKPRLIVGFVALFAGLILGVAMSRRVPQEVVVTAQGANVVDVHTTLKGPRASKWVSYSPVWAYESGRMGYAAKQGDAGHFRRDLSLLVGSKALPKGASFSAMMTLERVELPLDVKRTQHLVREALGGIPEPAAGGVFYSSDDGNRAVGMQVFTDGTCGVVELFREHGLLRVAQYEKGICHASVAKPIEIGISCDKTKGECAGSVAGRRIVLLHVSDMEKNEWKPAFACRNVNCLFGLSETN